MNIEAKFAFVLYYVDDIEAARRFYVETLGLTVQRHHPTFLQFENFAIASDEAVGGSREPEVYWVVPDANASLCRTFTDVSKLQSHCAKCLLARSSPSKTPAATQYTCWNGLNAGLARLRNSRL